MIYHRNFHHICLTLCVDTLCIGQCPLFQKKGIDQCPLFQKEGIDQCPFLTEKCDFFHVWRYRDQGIPGYMDITILFFKILQWEIP